MRENCLKNRLMVLNKKLNDLEVIVEEIELDKVCELLFCFKCGVFDFFELIISVYNNCEIS